MKSSRALESNEVETEISHEQEQKARRELWRIWAKTLATALPHLAGYNDQTSNLLFVIISNLITALSLGDVAAIERMAANIHASVGLTIDIIESGGDEDDNS